MTASVSLLNSPARTAVVSRVDGAGDAGTPRRAEAPPLVLLGDARRRGVFVFFQDRGEVHGLLAEQRRTAVARVLAVVHGCGAQMPLQMPTKVVSYISTRLSDIEDVYLLDVTLLNEEDVELSGPFDKLFFKVLLDPPQECSQYPAFQDK